MKQKCLLARTFLQSRQLHRCAKHTKATANVLRQQDILCTLYHIRQRMRNEIILKLNDFKTFFRAQAIH